MFKVKLVVIGPSKSGKTCLSNFLSNAVEKFGGEYRATQGVRILEFESSLLKVRGKTVNTEIELWDCSGDLKYKHLWSVFLHKADGCIFVYDPSGANDVKELEQFLDFYVDVTNIDPENCVIFANNKRNKRSAKKLSDKFSSVKQLSINIDSDRENLKPLFDDFIVNILVRTMDMKDQEENMINQQTFAI